MNFDEPLEDRSGDKLAPARQRHDRKQALSDQAQADVPFPELVETRPLSGAMLWLVACVVASGLASCGRGSGDARRHL